MNTTPYFSQTLGDFNVTVLPVGRLALDGGAMFGVVPKVLWEKQISCDEHNRIPLGLNCLLIHHKPSGERLLLDTGCGTKFSAKHQAMYGVENTAPIADKLAPLGLSPDDITTVMFTHLHFDHAGGASYFDEAGNAQPTFKNARFVIHRGEWEDAWSPTPKSKASYLTENLQPIKDSGRLELFDADPFELLPGLTLETSGGHTAYHQILVIDTPDGGLIYWGDLIPTSRHLRIPYVMAYDLYPVDTMSQKERLLKRAYDKRWLNVFEHDLDVPACYLDYDEARQSYQPRPTQLATA